MNDQLNQSPATQNADNSENDALVTPLGHSGSARRGVSPKNAATATRKQSKSKKATPCRFFATKNGCRAGVSCPFLHEGAAAQRLIPVRSGRYEEAMPEVVEDGSPAPAAEVGKANGREGAMASPLRAQRPAVAKPVPSRQYADPREFELTQLRRRFTPKEEEIPNGTVLTFKLVPSDPDFPFELNGLQTILTIPKSYPKDGKPTVRITNQEMERGYQINVERGFNSLVARYPTKTLLGLVNELDRNLEELLVSEKAQTIKITANSKGRPEPSSQSQPQAQPQPPVQQQPVEPPALRYVAVAPAPTFTAQQKTDARARRDADIRQLEARMGRQALFSKSSEVSFNVPLQIPKAGRLPPSLQSVKDIRLLVPSLYPLEPCNIRFKDGSEESELVEMAFEKHSRDHKELSLMALVNHLVQNLHVMVKEKVGGNCQESVPAAVVEPVMVKEGVVEEKKEKNQGRVFDEERPHLQIIQRPPEWDVHAIESNDEESDSSEWDEDSDSNSEEDDEEEGGIQVPSADLTSGPERGILLSFPLIELYNIELLQITSLSLTVKCDRCKESTDIKNIKPASSSSSSSSSTTTTTTPHNAESCRKCANPLRAAYRGELLHMNSIRAGFLDLEGCTPVDLLPTTFLPTCAECSTPLPAPGLISVRGETAMSVCRECHRKLSFKLPEVKFLRVSTAERPNRPLPRKKAKENLGIVAGTELPKKGRCRHYGKSYRWFRFSCCGKVYPCDRCHDGEEEHPNEHANRMICGFCSREQNYRPEDCGVCRGGLVGKKGGGFWEGGKGTRDKVKMSRKDPRKFKRKGGSKMGGGGQ